MSTVSAAAEADAEADAAAVAKSNDSSAPNPTTTLTALDYVHPLFHTAVSVMGIGALALPFAASFLGFYVASVTIVIVCVTSYFTGIMMIQLQYTQPDNYIRSNGDTTFYARERTTYYSIGEAAFGEPWSNKYIAPFVACVYISSFIGSVIFVGQTLDSVQTTSSINERYFIVIAGVIIFITSSIPMELDGRSCVVSSIIGISSYLVFIVLLDYMCGEVISASNAEGAEGADVDYGRPLNYDGDARMSTLPFVVNIFNSVGIIATAYGGHSVLPEVHSSLRAELSNKQREQAMMVGFRISYVFIFVSYLVVMILGYAAFGSTVNGDLLLSVIDSNRFSYAIESAANWFTIFNVIAMTSLYNRCAWLSLDKRFLGDKYTERFAGRMIIRVSWCVVLTTVCVIMPFFSIFLGISGSIGFIPMTFIVPIVLHLKVNDNLGAREAMFWKVVAVFFALLAVMGTLSGFYLLVQAGIEGEMAF